MTQDEIIEVAKQAGFQTGFINYMSGLGGYPFVKVIGTGEVLPNLERFAKLVAAKAFQSGYEKGVAAFNEAVELEREACAKLCDKEVEDWKYDADVVDVAIAIRARGEATHSPQRTEPKVCCQEYDTCLESCTPRGTHLAQRTWVGLTVEEIAACCMESTTTQLSFYNAIEAKLKQKNGFAEEKNT
jgi:hypothetical protein